MDDFNGDGNWNMVLADLSGANNDQNLVITFKYAETGNNDFRNQSQPPKGYQSSYTLTAQNTFNIQQTNTDPARWSPPRFFPLTGTETDIIPMA